MWEVSAAKAGGPDAVKAGPESGENHCRIPEPAACEASETQSMGVEVETPVYDLTVFHVHYGKLSLKIYS